MIIELVYAFRMHFVIDTIKHLKLLQFGRERVIGERWIYFSEDKKEIQFSIYSLHDLYASWFINDGLHRAKPNSNCLALEKFAICVAIYIRHPTRWHCCRGRMALNVIREITCAASLFRGFFSLFVVVVVVVEAIDLLSRLWCVFWQNDLTNGVQIRVQVK